MIKGILFVGFIFFVLLAIERVQSYNRFRDEEKHK